ncbi:MAG TPA: glycosyltransferase family 4 protein [Bacteroidales bacterium]|nr:glycosyltransferase family 4 protein [Bacteroidales bacterium]HRX96686.1 glycosyltransferase family 4 protein [Bacteroidales bacterium]
MAKNIPKICLVADSHALYDDRIYWKEACSLVKAGYEVHYVLAGDHDSEGVTDEGIKFYILQRDQSSNRYFNYLLKRFAPGGLYQNLLKKAASTKADVFHLHDLKVLRLVERLKSLPNKPKVIYDVHEPYPENIIDYDHGHVPIFKQQYANLIRNWEKRKAANCDLIITTEENLQNRFRGYFPGKPVEIIYNYTNLPASDVSTSENLKEFNAIYTGGITRLRGALKILEAVKIIAAKRPEFKMLFLGSWFPASMKTDMEDFISGNQIQENVILKESVPYNEVVDYYRKSKIGLGIFLPIPTHRIILQIKIFEYMNFGLPIVGSNFGHINAIIQKHQCGISVDPENPQEIADALVKLIEDEKLYRQFSINGQKAAQQFYRWELMENKLISIYKNLMA